MCQTKDWTWQTLCLGAVAQRYKVWEASEPKELPNQTADQRISEVGRATFQRLCYCWCTCDQLVSSTSWSSLESGPPASRWHVERHFGGWRGLVCGPTDHQSKRDHGQRPQICAVRRLTLQQSTLIGKKMRKSSHSTDVPLPGLMICWSIDGLSAVFHKHILIDWGSIRLRHGPKWNEIISNFRSSPLSHFLHCFLTNDTSTTRVWHAFFVPGSHMMSEWGSNIVPRSRVDEGMQQLFDLSSGGW